MKLRILIIGSQGFVGSHVLLALINKFGAGSVYSTSIKDTALLGSAHCGDFRLTESTVNDLANFIRINKITSVVNAAGVIGVKPSSNPDMKIATAIVNSFKLLKNRPDLLYVGSSSEYTSVEFEVDTDELSECQPSSIYGNNKLAVTKFLLKSSNQLNFKLCVCRVFNIIGPKMNTKTILGKLYNEVVLNKKREIDFFSLSSYRDYIDIRDVADAIVKLIVKINSIKYFSKILNVGSGNALQMRSLINQIKHASNDFFEFTEVNDVYGDKNIFWQRANIEKIKEIISWKTQYTTSQSIHYFLNKED